LISYNADLFLISNSYLSAGDIIWYFKTDDKKKGGVSINPKEIGICKYKEMLMATVKDALEILGYGSAEKIESDVYGIEGMGLLTRRSPTFLNC
jgi:hypothetical protein